MYLLAGIIATSKPIKRDGLSCLGPSVRKQMSDNIYLISITRIFLYILIIAIKQRTIDRCKLCNIFMPGILGQHFGHTTNKGVSVKVVDKQFVIDIAHLSFAYHVGQRLLTYGIKIFKKRTRTQRQILNTSHRKGDALLKKRMQTRASSYNMQPRHLLIEIAQQFYRLGLTLYLINKQQCALRRINHYLLLKTQILKYLFYIIRDTKHKRIGTKF